MTQNPNNTLLEIDQLRRKSRIDHENTEITLNYAKDILVKMEGKTGTKFSETNQKFMISQINCKLFTEAFHFLKNTSEIDLKKYTHLLNESKLESLYSALILVFEENFELMFRFWEGAILSWQRQCHHLEVDEDINEIKIMHLINNNLN